MHVKTSQPLHRRLWHWFRDQIAQEVPESDELCAFDCRKLQCTEEEWANCDRRIRRAAGELWPDSSPAPHLEPSPTPGAKPRQSVPRAEPADYRSIHVAQSPGPLPQPEQDQALARLKCVHCQSLINCDALARSVLAELQRRYRVDCRNFDGGSNVTEPELIEAVREGIDCFLRNSSECVESEGPRPSAAAAPPSSRLFG